MAAPGFGFSFGDFVQAISLLNDVRKALKDSGGAVDEFQQVLTDLQQLEIILRQLDRGGWDGNADAGHTNAVKGMALTCQVPLRAFLEKIKKYNVMIDREKKSMKLHLKSGVRKVEWAVRMQEEVARFRAVILSKVVTLSLLLALPMFSTVTKINDRTKSIEESVDETKEKLTTKIDEHRKATTRLEDNVKDLQNAQVAVSFNTRRLVKICAGVKVGFGGFRQLWITEHEKMELQLKRIEETQRSCMDMVPVASLSVGRYIGKLGTRLEKLIEYFGGYTAEILQILRRMMRTDLEMYTLLRQIMDELPRTPRFPTQNCINFTDVLGRNELLPYQWFQDWDVFESMLKVKFKDLPGERSVKSGQYVMLDTTRRDYVIDVHFWKQSVFPGSSVTMSVVVTGQHFIRGVCPRPDCDSKNDADRQLISTELTVCPACGLEYRYSEPISNDNTSVPISHHDSKSVEDYEHRQPEELSKPSNYPKNPQVNGNMSDGVSDETVGETNIKRVTWAKELWAFKKVHVNATDAIQVIGLTSWLSNLDYREQQERYLRVAVAGFCRWFFAADEYVTCVEKSRKSLLCYGSAGTGKTSLMAVFVERLQQRFSNDKTVGIAYLYIEDIYSSAYCSATISSLLGSICRQILRFPLDDGLVRSYNQHQNMGVQGQASKSHILYALQQTVANYSRVMVVIDGIDALPLGFPLDELFSELSRLSVQTFTTSRPKQNIMEYFKVRNDILLKMGSSEFELYSFIKKRSMNSTVLARLMRADDTTLSRISAAVFERCEGTILLAQLLVEAVAQSQPTSRESLDRALRLLPEGLERTYERLFSLLVDQIHSYSESPLRILAWLSYLETSVTLTELREALALDPAAAYDKNNMITEEFFTECCAGLLTYDDATAVIRWVHQSAEEYFKIRRVDLFPETREEIMEIRPEWLGAEPVSKPSKKTASQTTQSSLNGNKSTKRNTNLASLSSTRTPPRRSVKSKVVFTTGEEQLKRTQEGRTNLWAGYETERIIRDEQVHQTPFKMADVPFFKAQSNLSAGYGSQRTVQDDQVQQGPSKRTPFWKTLIDRIL